MSGASGGGTRVMSKRFIVAMLLAAAPLGAAHAQDRDLDSEPSLGKIVAGEVPEGGGTARFVMALAADRAVELTVAPVAGSDPVVRVYDAATDSLIAENDDSAGSLASNVRLYSAQAKRVRIEVGNAAVEDGDAPMRFDLILRPSDWRPKPVTALTLGAAPRGTLARSDEQLFSFAGERGQVWDLALSAAPGSSLDPALQVFAGEVAGGPVLGENDDGGGGLNARLRFRVPEAGIYTVRAYGVGTSEGAFTLAAGAAAATPAVALRDIELGRPAAGTLELGSDEHFFRLGERARAAVAAGAGSLVVDLRRVGEGEGEGALDPVLEIGFDTPLGFTSLLNDDDGGDESNARLVLDTAGLGASWLEALRIRASSFLETTGDYELTVSGD